MDGIALARYTHTPAVGLPESSSRKGRSSKAPGLAACCRVLHTWPATARRPGWARLAAFGRALPLRAGPPRQFRVTPCRALPGRVGQRPRNLLPAFAGTCRAVYSLAKPLCHRPPAAHDPRRALTRQGLEAPPRSVTPGEVPVT